MRVPGCRFDPAAVTHGTIAPFGVVLHRTFGRWGGDYSVGKTNPSGVGFQFLFGKDEFGSDGRRRAVQFADTTAKCWHAPGANSTTFGIEFEGAREPLTEFQVRCGAWTLAVACQHHGIPLDYYTGPRRPVARGVTQHASVMGSDHTDGVSRADWDRMMALLRPAPPAPDWAAIRRVAAGLAHADLADTPTPLGGGAVGEHVLAVQRALNVQVTHLPRLAENSVYDDDTIRRVLVFQSAINALRPGSITDFPGALGDTTKWWLCASLANIRDGKA